MPLGYIPGSHPGLYSSISHRIFGSRKFSRMVEFRLLKNWLPKGRVKVLDVGAGSCELAVQLALMGHDVTALDFDERALNESRTIHSPELAVIAGDATRLPLESDSFDLVVSNSSIEHFPDDDRAVSEMARVVRPGGRLLVTTDSFPDAISRWLEWVPATWRKRGMERGEHLLERMKAHHQESCFVVNYYRTDSLAQLFSRHGLVVEECRSYLDGRVSKGIFELHIVLKWLDFYNSTSRRVFPLLYPFAYARRGSGNGYGVAIKALKPQRA